VDDSEDEVEDVSATRRVVSKTAKKRQQQLALKLASAKTKVLLKGKGRTKLKPAVSMDTVESPVSQQPLVPYQPNYSLVPQSVEPVLSSDTPYRLPFLSSSDVNMMDALGYPPTNPYIPNPPPPPNSNYVPPSVAELYSRGHEIARVAAMLRQAYMANMQTQNTAPQPPQAVTYAPPQLSPRNLLSGPSDRFTPTNWAANMDRSLQVAQPLPIMSPPVEAPPTLTSKKQLALTHAPEVNQELGNVMSLPRTISDTQKIKNVKKAMHDVALARLNEKLKLDAAAPPLPREEKSKEKLWLPLPTVRKRSHQTAPHKKPFIRLRKHKQKATDFDTALSNVKKLKKKKAEQSEDISEPSSL
jgi:hypothetical protein